MMRWGCGGSKPSTHAGATSRVGGEGSPPYHGIPITDQARRASNWASRIRSDPVRSGQTQGSLPASSRFTHPPARHFRLGEWEACFIHWDVLSQIAIHGLPLRLTVPLRQPMPHGILASLSCWIIGWSPSPGGLPQLSQAAWISMPLNSWLRGTLPGGAVG